MDKITLVTKMVEVSDELDSRGLVREAAVMDGVMKKVAQDDEYRTCDECGREVRVDEIDGESGNVIHVAKRD